MVRVPVVRCGLQDDTRGGFGVLVPGLLLRLVRESFHIHQRRVRAGPRAGLEPAPGAGANEPVPGREVRAPRRQVLRAWHVSHREFLARGDVAQREQRHAQAAAVRAPLRLLRLLVVLLVLLLVLVVDGTPREFQLAVRQAAVVDEGESGCECQRREAGKFRARSLHYVEHPGSLRRPRRWRRLTRGDGSTFGPIGSTGRGRLLNLFVFVFVFVFLLLVFVGPARGART